LLLVVVVQAALGVVVALADIYQEQHHLVLALHTQLQLDQVAQALFRRLRQLMVLILQVLRAL
jgi:hypothetical protein